MKVIRILIFLIFTSFISCSPSSDHEGTSQVHVSELNSPNEIRINKQQYKTLGIETSKMVRVNLSDDITANGHLKVPPQNKAIITSMLGGTVKNILVHEGSYVAKGQALVTLSNPAFIKLQQSFIEVRSQYEYATLEADRQKVLADNDITAKKLLQQALKEQQVLYSNYRSLGAQLIMAGCDTSKLEAGDIRSDLSITSPISGHVSHVEVNIGSTVSPSTEMLQLIDNSQLHLDLFIYERDLPKVKAGQQVDFSLTNLPQKQFTAVIFGIGSAFDGSSKSIPVHAEIKGDKTGLIEGMNVTAHIHMTSDSLYAIPETALINDNGNDYIFVRKHDGINSDNDFIFEKIRVVRGISNQTYTSFEALDKLNSDPEIATSGVFYLMSMTKEEGHEGH